MKRTSIHLLLPVLLGLAIGSVHADTTAVTSLRPSGIAKKFLKAAMKYQGVPFQADGRTEKGLDALGLVFVAYKKATGRSWARFSTWPRILVETEALGRPVAGLDGIGRDWIDLAKLGQGDIVHFLVPMQVGSDPDPLVVIGEVDYWVAGVGIYAGDSLLLYVKPDDRVRLDRLDVVLGERDAIFVTRLDKP